ncbi:MAG: hypothetical protein ACM3JB_12015 [Acidobacteriaceae bacterium]
MKTQIRPILVLLALIIGTLGVAVGQTPDDLKVNVPFDFSAANRHLPAGEYKLLRVNDRDPNLLRLVNADGDSAVLFLPHNEPLGSGNSRFVFQNDGETFVLTALRTTNDTYKMHNARANRLSKMATTEYSIRGSN